MKREIDLPSKTPLIIYRVIVVVFIVLIVLFIFGNLLAFFRSSGSGPLFQIGRQKSSEVNLNTNTGITEIAVFSGMGRLRIPVAGQPPSTVILSISFPYPVSDRPFTEELASHIGDFRSIAAAYFTSLSPEKIAFLDEEAAKMEILKRYNAILRLGKIETLYFSDFMVIE